MRWEAVLAVDLSLALNRAGPTQSLADLSQPALAARLRGCDLLLDLSDAPAGELVTLAAMACGCAVVIARREGVPGFVRHEENALVVDHADPNAPAAAMARLLEDRALQDRLRCRAAVDAAARPHRRAALALANALFAGDREVSSR
jgi:glycosyltransferase involved in cell wall biosynthesis